MHVKSKAGRNPGNTPVFYLQGVTCCYRNDEPIPEPGVHNTMISGVILKRLATGEVTNEIKIGLASVVTDQHVRVQYDGFSLLGREDSAISAAMICDTQEVVSITAHPRLPIYFANNRNADITRKLTWLQPGFGWAVRDAHGDLQLVGVDSFTQLRYNAVPRVTDLDNLFAPV